MSVKQQIDQDLKQAMLGGDKVLVTTLRGLKSAILYVEVATGKRDEGLPDEEIRTVLAKEAKKRQESADLYDQGGNAEKAAAEREEKRVIEQYLPAQLSDEDLNKLVDQALSEVEATGPQAMGQAIGKVKQLSQGQADGARIAAAVKARLK
ncbi:MAG TPA: GatB/YqeY domain-containing protein [Patescibacteria group bacterium]|nr:GatB/YqeY domain-containing protein [Patescibacteria group bacterium]